MNSEEPESDGSRMFFISKAELLKTISGIYESLIDISYDLAAKKELSVKLQNDTEKIKRNVEHLRKILIKDLTVSEDNNTSVNLMKIQMNAEKWNSYINASGSSSEDQDEKS
jgi:hypothetical protein